MSAQPQSWPAAAEGCTAELPQLPAHHARNCKICQHPDRGLIEFKFLRWHKATEIAQEFGLYDRHNVYRHARAAGLYQRRRHQFFPIYERMIENFDFTKVTTRDILVAAQRLERYTPSEQEGYPDRSLSRISSGRTPHAAVSVSTEPPQPTPKCPQSIAPGCAATAPEVTDSKDQKIPETHQNRFSPNRRIPHLLPPLPAPKTLDKCPTKPLRAAWPGWPVAYPPIHGSPDPDPHFSPKDLLINGLHGFVVPPETFCPAPG